VMEANGRDRVGEGSPDRVLHKSLVEALSLLIGKLRAMVADVKEGDDQHVRPEAKSCPNASHLHW